MSKKEMSNYDYLIYPEDSHSDFSFGGVNVDWEFENLTASGMMYNVTKSTTETELREKIKRLEEQSENDKRLAAYYYDLYIKEKVKTKGST